MNFASLNTSNLVKHLKMHHAKYTQYRHQFLQANEIHYWNNLFLGLFESLLHYSFNLFYYLFLDSCSFSVMTDYQNRY